MNVIRKLSVLLIILFIIVSQDGISQVNNLVKNPSFEQYKECPESHNLENKSHELVPGWSYPNGAAPDYFHKCGGRDASVPENFAGKSYARDGDAYVGAILTGDSEKSDVGNVNIERREYIQGEFKTPLKAGKKYCVTYYYRLASGSRFAVDQMNIYFCNEKVENKSIKALHANPQLKNPEGLFLDDVEGWKRKCYVYDAEGGEKFFIVGNFRNYENTNYIVTDKNVVNRRDKAYAYYYYDMFKIFPMENCNDCPCVQHDFESKIVEKSYTGGLDPITGRVEKIVDDGQIKVSMIGGTPPYRVIWNNGLKGEEINNLGGGKYIYTAYDKNNCQSSDSVIFVEPEIEKDEFEEGLQSIKEGASLVLENIFFEYNETTLLPESYSELNKVADFMLENDIKKIEISGHTDSDGSESYNQKLSEGRAKSVVKYLEGHGVSPDRMIAKGYGESKPIETNLTDEGKAVNRRVEFKLIKK